MNTSIFAGKNSDRGRLKQTWLKKNRLIGLNFPAQAIPWRVTWETFQHHSKTNLDMVQAELGKCDNGPNVVSLFAERRTRVETPFERFERQMNSALTMLTGIEDYQPEYGFDMDMFWKVNNHQNIKVVCELYPRFGGKSQDDAFTSMIAFSEPIVPNGPPSPLGIPHEVLALIAGERQQRDVPMNDIIDEWNAFRGVWTIEEEFLVALHISCGLFSLMGRGAERTLVAQIEREGPAYTQGTVYFL